MASTYSLAHALKNQKLNVYFTLAAIDEFLTVRNLQMCRLKTQIGLILESGALASSAVAIKYVCTYEIAHEQRRY